MKLCVLIRTVIVFATLAGFSASAQGLDPFTPTKLEWFMLYGNLLCSDLRGEHHRVSVRDFKRKESGEIVRKPDLRPNLEPLGV